MVSLQGLEVVLMLLVAVAAIAPLAEKLEVPYPVLLVIGGLLIHFIPGLPRFSLDPDLVFLVFLPPLLFYAGLMTSWRDVQANLVPIMLLAVGLVLVTMAAVAGAYYLLIGGTSLAAAFVLGAIISPTDTVAALAVFDRLRVPRRIYWIVGGESLVNDATALVAWRFALAAAIAGGAFSYTAAVGSFFVVSAGGIGVGLGVGLVAAFIRRRVQDALVGQILILMMPYAAYLPAEAFGVSGVLSVVTAGVLASRALPATLTPAGRIRVFATWETLNFMLNGAIFILIGLQLPTSLDNLAHIPWPMKLWYGTIISFIAIALRLAWVFAATYLPRLVVPALRRSGPPLPWRYVLVIGWSGIRGIVSLAAALAIPLTLPDRITPFAERDMIIFLTFCVIFSTLVIQGLTLAPLIRLLGLGDDGIAAKEERTARIEAAHAALSRLEVLAFDQSISPTTINRVRAAYDDRIARLGGPHFDQVKVDPKDPQAAEKMLLLEAIAAERRMITYLRNNNVIGDEVLRKLLREIDLEEARIAG